MKAKRWTLGVVLAAAVGLFGLIHADASPFSTFLLSDDLGNTVNGKAPKIFDNAGHGNNEDGVDSSNKGASAGALGGDASCEDPDSCVDDESSGGGAAPSKGKGKKK